MCSVEGSSTMAWAEGAGEEKAKDLCRRSRVMLAGIAVNYLLLPSEIMLAVDDLLAFLFSSLISSYPRVVKNWAVMYCN